MDFKEYQIQAATTDKMIGLDTETRLCYYGLKLSGEAGEVSEKIGKLVRGDTINNFEEDLAKELGDVLWYISRLAEMTGYSLNEIALINLEKLSDRDRRNMIRGNGDDR